MRLPVRGRAVVRFWVPEPSAKLAYKLRDRRRDPQILANRANFMRKIGNLRHLRLRIRFF